MAALPAPSCDLSLEEINLGEAHFFTTPEIHGALAKLRHEAPVIWHDHPDSQGRFLSLLRWDDIAACTLDTEHFSSTGGVSLQAIAGNTGGQDSMIEMDPPKHTAARKLVNRGFTPKRVRELAPLVRDRVDGVLDAIADQEEVDFVTQVAQTLPAAIICDMMGIPESDHGILIELTNKLIFPKAFGVRSSEFAGLREEIDDRGHALAKEKMNNPGDDLTSLLVNAEIGEEPLPAEELGGFFRLLVAAGNETTRTALAQGMITLSEWPDQRAKWVASTDEDDLAWRAAEEIIRWSSPLLHMRRTVTKAVEFRGEQLEPGDRIAMWYASANRDEDHIDDPYRFDIAREPNYQAGFGTGGAHFCLGAQLARREVAVTLARFFQRFPDATVCGEPNRVDSNFINGVQGLPVRLVA